MYDSVYTIMYDKYKGLIQATQVVFSNTKHKFYVRHLCSNMKRAGYRGETIRIALWHAARTLTVNEWECRIKDLKDMDEHVF